MSDLLDQISSKRIDIKTDGYPMSIGEWVSMYEQGELDIHPEFQRFYRWSSSQKTSLIESILLGIPLPPIFVSQRNDGVWDVVDGLQRLSTIFQFLGILKDENGGLESPLVLEGTKYLPALANYQWNDEGDEEYSIPNSLKLLFKRSKISASIVLKESDESAKYDLFQRLNTGGSELSPQEVRNCLLLMINKPFFDWLKALPADGNFSDSTALSDRPLEQAYDVELALRFVILHNIDDDQLKGIGDVGLFLTDKMTELARNKKFQKNKVKKLFESTFSVLNETLGEDSFKRYSLKKNRHEGGFLLSLYEAIALGVAYNIENNTLCDEGEIAQRAQNLWRTRAFTDWTSSGITASRRLPRVIPLGRKAFSNL